MKNVLRILPAGLCLLVAAQAFGAGQYKFVDGTKNFYIGHISFVELRGDGEDPVVLRDGFEEAEPASLNLPVGPGDTIRTSASRRCEIQFDTGTIIRLDVGTELRVETILAKSLSSSYRISSFVLEKGRLYLMYKSYGAEEMFQVLTPNAALKLKHQTVAIVRAAADRSTDVQVKYGRVSVLLGADAKTSSRQDVGREERLIILEDHQVQMASYIADTDFERWNEEINRNFEALHEGKSALPRPLTHLPAAVHYFAQNFGNQNGEWLWDDICGYVWRPFLNDGRYPWGGWQPYLYGHWTEAQGQMFWVPEEPWGWIPYHLGIWQWDVKKGWFWIPGSFFAPAWADWEFFFGYAAWRPLVLYDFTSYAGWSGEGLYRPEKGWPGGTFRKVTTPPVTVIRRDQLKKPGAPVRSLPKEIKSAAGRLAAAINRGDASALESLRGVPSSLRFVRREDIGARRIQEKALTFNDIARSRDLSSVGEASRAPDAPRAEALRGWRGSAARADLGSRPESLRTMGPNGFRDWNPDVVVARALGVRLQYSGAKNEIRCPELGITSHDRGGRSFGRPSLHPEGIRSFGGGAFSGSPGMNSGSPGSAAAAASHRGASSGGHAAGATGEKTKN